MRELKEIKHCNYSYCICNINRYIDKVKYLQVNQNDTWESFLRPLRLPHPCINGSTLLRRIYGSHLEK